MSMIRRLFYRLSFEREQKRLCAEEKCSTIQPDMKGVGYCARCGREYLWLKNDRQWLHAGTRRAL